MSDSWDDLAIALGAARLAGSGIMGAFRTQHQVTFKSPDQPVTDADRAADVLLKRVLLHARPDYGWLSEESADNEERLGRQKVWIVDPIDGTSSFVDGIAEFAVSIAVADAGRPVVGVVLNPATGECFHAVDGGGAWLGERRLRVRQPDEPIVLTASRGDIDDGELAEFADCTLMPLGSTAYKMAQVAAGVADAFLSQGGRSEWDTCAADLIVRESGGVVSDLMGRALVYNKRDPTIDGVLTTTAELHAGLLARSRRRDQHATHG